MQSQRFFIGNLRPGTTENEIKKAFKDFGDVTNIVIKSKESLVDSSSVKLLAFVTLNLYNEDVDFCLRKLNSKQINGEYVQVSVAKESFLERLKREREESSKGAPKTSNNNFEVRTPHSEIPNKSKKFFDTEEDVVGVEDEDIEPLLITKKRAANSMRNGKIVIEGTNAAPITVIGKQKDVKHLSDKSFDADKKRKESVNKKKNQYQLQKSLIQKSLASVDNSKNKQVFFENDEQETKTSSKSKQLFEDESDQEEPSSHANDFAMKAEHEGSRGAALMKLQSKMSSDPRFKIDSKFVDDVEDEDEPMQNENNERNWQYGILEQVVGSKVTNNSNAQVKGPKKNKLNMVRYDPSKENQDQFLVKNKATEPMDEEEENIVPQVKEKKVSKEVFYMVSENLTNSLKTRGDGFSLLSMFGKGSEENEIDEDRTLKEKILISQNDKSGELNPFTYDSSSDSEMEQEKQPQQKVAQENETMKSKEKKKEKSSLFVESFFIPKNDARLKEGKLFFRTNKQSEKIENYDEVKDKLRNIIKRKITKSKKQKTKVQSW